MLNLVQLIIAMTLITLMGTIMPSDQRADIGFTIAWLGWVMVGFTFCLLLGYWLVKANCLKWRHESDLSWENDDPAASKLRATIRKRVLRTLSYYSLSTDIAALLAFAMWCTFGDIFDFGLEVFGTSVAGTLGLMIPWFLMLACKTLVFARLRAEILGEDAKPLRQAIFVVVLTAVAFVPFFLIEGILGLASLLFPDLELLYASFTFFGPFSTLLVLPAIIWFLPLILRVVFRTTRIEKTTYASSTSALLAKAKAPVDRVFVIKTKPGGMKNAFMIGIAWPFRFVFVTQALLESMEDSHAEAVIAHELGHAKHRHLLQMLGFMATFLLLETTMACLLSPAPLGATRLESISIESPFEIALWILPVALFLLGFGYLSRRYERQADAFAARMVGDQAIAGALLSLARSSGIDIHKNGWRHFSIARRVRELAIANPLPGEPLESSKSYQRRWRAEKGFASLAVLMLAAAATFMIWPYVDHDYRTGIGTLAAYQANERMDAGHVKSAYGRYNAAYENMFAYAQDAEADPDVRISMLISASQQLILARGNDDLYLELQAKYATQMTIKAWRSVHDELMRAYNEKRAPREVTPSPSSSIQ